MTRTMTKMVVMRRKNKKANGDRLVVAKMKIDSRDNKIYFFGLITLVALITLLRPHEANSILGTLLNMGGGVGIGLFIRK